MTSYTVTVPTVGDSTIVRFSFGAQIGSSQFKFYLYWHNNRWLCYVSIDSTNIRELGVVPGIVNWSRYLDYNVIFNFSGDSYGYSDIFGSTITIEAL